MLRNFPARTSKFVNKLVCIKEWEDIRTTVDTYFTGLQTGKFVFACIYVFTVAMATPPTSSPQSKNPPEVTSKRTRQSTRLRSLTTRCLDGSRPVVNVNPATGKGSRPHKEKFHSYLGVAAREKVPIVHANWNVVPDDLKTLIWKYILGIQKKAQEIKKFNDCPHILSRGGYELLDKKLMEEKSKRRHEEHLFIENPTLNVDPPSPVARHLKWKIAHTKRYGQMTSEVAQEIADKIISQQQLAKIIGGIKDDIRKEVQEEHKQQQKAWMRAIEEKQWQNLEIMKQELKKALKIELSHIASHQSTPIEVPEIQALLAHVSTKVVGQNIVLTGLEKVFENSSTIHNVCYANDVVKVNVVRTYMPHAEVPIPTSEVRILEQAVGTFVSWLTHLVRKVTNEVVMGPDKPPLKSIGEPTGDKCLNIFVLQLWMMFMNDWSTSIGFAPVYDFLEPQSIRCTKDTREECQQYIETWVKDDGSRSLLRTLLQSFDGEFHVVDFRAHWQLLVLCPRENIVVWFYFVRRKPDIYIKFAVNNAMKKICNNFQGKDNAPPPPSQWIEAKSHVQPRAYECGYYVMHWMWCIVSGGLKNELHNFFFYGTPLDTDTMATLLKKWAAYFLEVGKWM
ncbi:hypothetical protein GmHk_11G033068 [Glycine max]|nr:hypothetical protein GmHk_11G033068 [Glycine max]